MQYAITVCRFNDDDEQEMLVDHYITADQAIDAIVFAQGLEAVEDVEEEEIEEEPHLEPEVQPAKSAGKKGGPTKSKGGVTCSLCGEKGHNRKTCPEREEEDPHKGLKRGTDVLPSLASETSSQTPYMERRADFELETQNQYSEETEIKQAFRDGFSVAEVSPMYPKVAMSDLVRLKQEALA